MKVKNFTYLWCCLLLSCMFAIPQMSYSQAARTMACNDNVQISLNSDCEGVTLDMLLEGELGSLGIMNGVNYVLEVGSLTGYAFTAEGCSEFGVDSNGDGTIDFNDFDFMNQAACAGSSAASMVPPPVNPLNWGSLANGDAVTYKLTEQSSGNSCWGTVTVELNLLPTLPASNCIVTPGSVVSETIDLSDLSNSATATVSYTPNGCGAVSVSTDPGFVRYACDLGDDGIAGTPDDGWCTAACAFADDGMGTVTVTLSPSAGDPTGAGIPAAATCEVTVTVADCVPCIAWCSEDDSQSYPAGFITVDDIYDDIAAGCFVNIVGDIIVISDTEGDACSGTTIVHYYANVERHGEVNKELLMTQGFGTMGLDPLDVNAPRNAVPLDCGSVSTEATPDEIYAETGSGSLAYPWFADHHTTIRRTAEFKFLDHYEYILGTEEEMVAIDVDTDKDGVNDSQVWVLLPVVKKELRDSIVSKVWYVDVNGLPICFDDDGNCIPCTLENGGDDGIIYDDPDTDADESADNDILVTYDQSTCIYATDHAIVHIDGGKYCNLITSYSDAGPFEACGSGFKIVRTWSVIDWCAASALPIPLGSQFIEVRDTDAPEIGELDNATVSIDPWSCSAKYKLNLPSAEDGCDGSTIEYQVNASEGYYDKASGYLVDLWLSPDSITIDIDIADDCGNSTGTSFKLLVIDAVAPVPVCHNNLVVTLTTGGAAKLYASDLDAGSNDAGCGDVTVYAARMTGCCEDECEGGDEVCLNYDKFGDCTEYGATPEADAFGPFVKFCCEDAGQSVMVALLVVDKYGNKNTCMVEVQVVDKSAATLICEDAEITCLDDPSDVDGASPVAAVCVGSSADLLSETVSEDGCGQGYIIREWFIDADASGTWELGEARCEQKITITGEDKFDPHSIKWPIHYTGETLPGVNIECDPDDDLVEFDANIAMNPVFSCSAGTVNDAPVWCSTACGLVGYSMEPQTVVASDACLKVIQRWTVIDWCTWDPNESGVDDENDRGREEFEPVEDWTDGTECAGCDEALGLNYYFRYVEDEVDEDGYYTFDQVIKVVDDTDPTITPQFDDSPIATDGGNASKADDIACFGSADLTATASDACGGEDVGAELLTWVVVRSVPGEDDVTKSGSGSSITMNSGVGSPGDVHTIKWTVTDGCGNSSTATTEHTFGDSKAPTPLCISGVTTAFMETDGTADIWAKDFDLGSFDNCTAADDLGFSIVMSGSDPDPDSGNFTFSCADLQSFYELDVYVWDGSGNYDYCSVGVLVGGDCAGGAGEGGSSASIAGNVATHYGDMVDNATVYVNGNAGSEFPKNMTTENSGEYAFTNNPLAFDYNLNAERTGDYNNGVSTFDIVLIQKHILGLAEFDSPYKYLAADINNSGSVSASDLVELRQLILGKVTELSNNSSWRFVDAGQQFTDEANPWPFKEVIDVNNLAISMMDENFIGVKIGDLSGDASANSLMSATTRSNGLLTLTAEDVTFATGELVSVPVSATNFNSVAGYQFTLDHAGLTLQSIDAGSLDVSDANVAVNDGQLTMSWSEATAVSSAEVLFTLVFKSTSNGNLSNVLNLNSSVTKAEAYMGTSLDKADVVLAVGSTDVSTEFDLYQNSPNPFDAQTVIGFNLPVAGNATLRVYDVAGKTITSMTKSFAKGYNEIVLTKAQVGVEGVLYYELESGDNVATKKMIVIE